MRTKEIIVPFLIIGLTILFTIICFAVYVSNGKSKKWVARKIKIGGMLLSFTAASAGSGCITCYDMPSENYIQFDNISGYELELLLDTGNIITGTIYDRTASTFSFSVEDTLEQKIQTGIIEPIDGQFDTYEERIKIELDTNIIAGNYLLKVFGTDKLEQEKNYPINVISLLIKDE